MAIDIDITLLRSFLTTARNGSLSRAAQILGRTQPSLSQQIRRLEDIMGQSLFFRSTQGTKLTLAGEALLPYAERMVTLNDEVQSEISIRAMDGRRGIGLMEDIAASNLTSILAEFAILHPNLQLEVIVADSATLKSGLDNEHLDLVIGDTIGMRSPRWVIQNQLSWVGAPSFDLNRDPLPLALFSRPCNWRDPLLECLNKNECRWRLAFESTSVQAIQAAVRAGIALSALLPMNMQAGIVAIDLQNSRLPKIPPVELALYRRSGTERDRVLDILETLLWRSLQ